MTRLGKPVPKDVAAMRKAVSNVTGSLGFAVIDAGTRVTGRDFLTKIWKLIAASPVAIGICHDQIPPATQANIYYELGVAQTMGKETIIIKSPKAEVPSDFIRTEYIEFNSAFNKKFTKYLRGLKEQAEHYELIADQLESNPVLSLDYLKRAYLLTGNDQLQDKIQNLLRDPSFKERARNSVERLVAVF